MGQPVTHALVECAQPAASMQLVDLASGRGLCLLLTWGTFDHPCWQTMMGVVHPHVGGPSLPGDPNPFRFAEPGSLPGILRAPGFNDVAEETRTLPWTWPGAVEEFWEQVKAVAVPFRPVLERLPAQKWPQIHSEVHAAVRRILRRRRIRSVGGAGFGTKVRLRA